MKILWNNRKMIFQYCGSNNDCIDRDLDLILLLFLFFLSSLPRTQVICWARMTQQVNHVYLNLTRPHHQHFGFFSSMQLSQISQLNIKSTMTDTLKGEKTLTAQCFCKSVHYEISLPTSSFPLKVHLCHCSICRHTHGTLASS